MKRYQICLNDQILLRLREIQSLIKIDGDTVSLSSTGETCATEPRRGSLSEIINLCLEAGLNVILADLKQNESEGS